jgi:hypothetical protein
LTESRNASHSPRAEGWLLLASRMPAQAAALLSPEPPWRTGLTCARRLTLPGFVLVAAAAMVVTSYYHFPEFHAWLDGVAAFRMRWGLAYGAVAQALFAGLIPFLYLHFHPATRAAHPARHGAFFVLFWAYKGLEVDIFYRLQAAMFGDAPALANILPKVAVDQLVYNPLFAAPIAVLVYAWKDAGWSWTEPLADLRTPRWYYRRVLPVMIAVWVVWVPTVSCVYALPLALQLPLCSLVNCFWVILFSLMTAPERTA